jgi:hypothetical protein
MTVRGYTLGVDWSRDGSFAGTLEDVSPYVLAEVTTSYGRERTQTDGALGSGQLAFALRNNGRWFSPENATSPIAGKVLPGCRTRFDKLYNGTLYTLFDGVLDDFSVDPSAAARDFTATALDAWGRPGAEKLSTPVHSGVRTGDAIGLILDAINWTGARDIDAGATLITYWWEEGTDAATAVQKLVDSEGPPAIAYVQGGTFVFRDRHHRLTRTASATSNGTFTHIVPAGTGPVGDHKILKDSFSYDHGLKHIANTATFSVDQREPGDTEEVWSTDTPITLAAGQVLPIEVQASDPFIGALLPVLDTDYTVAFGTVTVALSRTSGQSVLLTLTAGGTAAQVDRIGVRAVPLPVVRTVKISEEDTSSIGTYGRQTWGRELPWAGVYDASAIAQRIVASYATARPVVTFEIAGVSAASLTQILARRISDRITIRNDEVGLNRDFIIEGIAHTVIKLGAIHKVRFTCEVTDPVQAVNAFTFDVAGKGFDQGAFGVNGIDDAATMFRFDVAGQGFDQGKFSS